jgi:3'-5' exoribonuclease
VTLADATGTVEANVWDHIEAFEQRGYARDMYVLAAGRVGEFRGKINASLSAMKPVETAEVTPADFIPVCPLPVEPMVAEFRGLMDSVGDPQLRALLGVTFHEKGRLWHDFVEAPSARMVHQAYLHGLLEHTLNVARNARALAACYGKMLDVDLLTTGALIHDMGKTVEFRWSPRIDYTDMGLLLGHISIGSNMLSQFAHDVDIDGAKLAHLNHLILSHHGKLEWGSPRLPCTAEAMVLHYADYADAQLAIYEESAHEAQEKGESWSSYNRFLERRLYAGGAQVDRDRMPGGYAADLARVMQQFEAPAERPTD